MRRIFALVLMSFPLLLSQTDTALGVLTEFNKGTSGTGIWNWTDSGNWTNGVPGAGDEANFTRINWANPIGLNTNGAVLNLGTGKMTGDYNGSVIAIFDSSQLTPNNGPLSSPTDFTPVSAASLESAASASPGFTMSELNYSKQHQLYLYQPLTVDNLYDNGSHYNFYGDVTVNTETKLNGRNDTTDQVHFRNTVTTPTLEVGRRTDVYFHSQAEIGELFMLDTSHNEDGDFIAEIGSSVSIETLNFYSTGTAAFELNADIFAEVLNVDDVEQGLGTWGALGSGADNEVAWITGDGLLNVGITAAVPEPGSIAVWALFGLALAGFRLGKRRW